MRSDLNIQRELEEISKAVATIPALTPYQAPEGYFETLPEVIQASIIARESEEAAIVGLAGKEPVFDVPAGYFEGLSSEILARIQQQEEDSVDEELARLAPVLATAPRSIPYEVPEGYFETMTYRNTAAVTQQQTARVISMNRSRMWMRFAAAAAVLLMITGSVYFYSGNNTTYDAVVKQGLQIQTEEAFQQSLAEVDNKELFQYLKTTSIGFTDENLPSMVESSTLPEETDYLDEEFLDSYLDELEKETTTTTLN